MPDLPLGLSVRFVFKPRRPPREGAGACFRHEVANALCRAKLQLECAYLSDMSMNPVS